MTTTNPYRVMALLALMAAAACSSPSVEPGSARIVLDNAAAAMGGWDALTSVASQEIQSRGTDWEPLQTADPDAAPRQINSFKQTIYVDYRVRRMRLAFDAVRTYPTTAPVQFVEVIDGDVGMLEGPKERLHPGRLATRLRDFDRMPMRLLFTARDAKDLKRVNDQLLTYTANGAPVELYFDGQTHLPSRVIYSEDDPVYGDTPNEVSFSDWKDFGDVKLPETQITSLNGKKIREDHVLALTNNPSINSALLAIPDSVKTQPDNGERIVSQWVLRRVVMGVGYLDFGRQQKVEFVNVAPGVDHVRGGSHHSMVIEMKDHLIVVEAPLFEERSVAVIRALEERFPGKPIKYLVITHFHFDHSGGVRAYVSGGATLVAHESIAPFMEEMIRRPHTLRPDSLAMMAVKPDTRIQRVADILTLADGNRTVELRSVENDHATGMIIAYLPREKVVFVSDLYSPPGPVPNPSVIFERVRARAFYDAVVKAQLKVETIVGGHGVAGPFHDLESAVR